MFAAALLKQSKRLLRDSAMRRRMLLAILMSIRRSNNRKRFLGKLFRFLQISRRLLFHPLMLLPLSGVSGDWRQGIALSGVFAYNPSCRFRIRCLPFIRPTGPRFLFTDRWLALTLVRTCSCHLLSPYPLIVDEILHLGRLTIFRFAT